MGRWKRWVGVIAVLGLAGCGGQPYTYVEATEIPPGPGLLTGERGVFGTPPRPAGGQ